MIRSKNRPVSSMMRNTTARVRGTACGHDNADAPAEGEQAHQHHDAECRREFHHELARDPARQDRGAEQKSQAISTAWAMRRVSSAGSAFERCGRAHRADRGDARAEMSDATIGEVAETVLDQPVGNHHVADAEIRIDAAGDAAHHKRPAIQPSGDHGGEGGRRHG